MRDASHNTPGSKDAPSPYSQSLWPADVSTATDLNHVADLCTAADHPLIAGLPAATGASAVSFSVRFWDYSQMHSNRNPP